MWVLSRLPLPIITIPSGKKPPANLLAPIRFDCLGRGAMVFEMVANQIGAPNFAIGSK